jgi:hypothetical protein
MQKHPTITDRSLAEFAATDSDERRSVIVELGVPLKVPLRPNGLRPYPPPVEELPTNDRRADESDEMDRLAEELRAQGLAESLVRLNLAQAFVVTVTPAQLRIISGSPLVGVIRPNRTHRFPHETTTA